MYIIYGNSYHKRMIVFNKPTRTGNEDKYVLQSMHSGHISENGKYTDRCHAWFEQALPSDKVLLTTSCTHALEMAAILLDIQEGDEIIMPSYTFVSTANAFVLRGAKIVFIDIRSDTLNINEQLIESAITKKTKAIVPVHYAGVGCEMDTIMAIAHKYNIVVIEDAAQGMMSRYKGKSLGTIGHLATFSFHETKNYTSGGTGGLLIINDKRFTERAEVIREKGTDKCQFSRGVVEKYSWIDIGSNYLLSDMQAAYLWGQLEQASSINQKRKSAWHVYYEQLKELEKANHIRLPIIPDNCTYNWHMFYLLTHTQKERDALLAHLHNNDIRAIFHYIPLHSSVAGEKYGRMHGKDIHTTHRSQCIIRLPLYYGIETMD